MSSGLGSQTELPPPVAAGPAERYSASARVPVRWRRWYLQGLAWAFALFSTLRMLAYLPTVATIARSGDSAQHSLWTWLIWMGANLTMSAWLYEHNGCRMDRAIAVSLGNAVMCLGTAVVIAWYRW
jgi:hypothetical protein